MNRKQKTKQKRDVAYWSEPAFLAFTEDLLSLMSNRISQAELARRVGVSRGYISRVFSGAENLSLETMTKLAIALGASVRLHVAPQDKVTRWIDVASVCDVVAEIPIGGAELRPEPKAVAFTHSSSSIGAGSATVEVVQ